MSDKRAFTIEQLIENAGEETKEASRWFGHFVGFYADIEGQCHVLFRRYCGVKETVSRAMISGARLADLLPKLVIVIDESDMAEHGKQDFHLCIEHLRHLTALRHRLVHRGFQRSTGIIGGAMGQFISSNLLTAKTRASAEFLRFYVEDIRAAAKDCLRIHTRMQFITLDQDPRPFLKQDIAQELYGPWLYKPVQPQRFIQDTQ